METKVITLSKRNDTKELDAMFDASLINGWSTQNSLNILEKTKLVLERSAPRLRSVIADNQ